MRNWRGRGRWALGSFVTVDRYGNRVCPTDIVGAELVARGWKADDMPSEVTRVAAGGRIGEQEAGKLAALFGTSAALWLNLQRGWDGDQLSQARHSQESRTP